ncbi:uncharacterized protein LOC134460972 [Engraulis encrasicolus]|uniref:uncharacterized protein LOC134460972 n=1 Tax=Engraulis encrasicolus TaxID=184585 RepID=UPI002FCF3D5C
MDRTLMVFVSAIAFSVCDSLVLKDKSLVLEDKMPGDNVSFNCSISGVMDNIDVVKGNQQGNVLIMNTQGRSPTIEPQYRKRISFTRPLNKLSVTITQLTEEDSGIYWCQYSGLTENGDVIKADSKEIITLLVKEPKQCPTLPAISPDSTMPVSSAVVCSNDSGPSIIMVSFSIVTAVVVFIMFSMMIIFHIIPKIKKLSSSAPSAQSRPNDSVYEVMSTTLRRT